MRSMERNSGTSTSSIRAHRSNSPTPRQRAFARAYLETGCAAEAARLAGYEGFYAPQAGYKLLRLRASTGAYIERLIRFDRLLLRRDLLRALRRIERAVRSSNLSPGVLRRAAGPLSDALWAVGLGHDVGCNALLRRLRRNPPNLRRFYALPWERLMSGCDGETDEGGTRW